MNNNNNAAAPGAADAQPVALPSFTEDPSAYLVIIGNKAASRENLYNLAGVVASCMKEESNPQLAFLYLQAVAKQLSAENESAVASAVVGSGSGGASGGGVGASGGGVGPSEKKLEAEMIRAQRRYEVLEAVGHAVVRCTNPRRSISHSGIIPALAKLFEDNAKDSKNSLLLSGAQVEFLQACVAAEQFRFAQRIVAGSWPRPNPAVSVRQVLRYFYLRGIVHTECSDWKMAVRCFWTCLSIPADIVSSVAIAAWKKMILIQCLLMRDDDISHLVKTNGNSSSGTAAGGSNHPAPSSALSSSSSPFSSAVTPSLSGGGPFSLPKALPSCIGRFLSLASSNPKKNAPTATTPPEDAHAHPSSSSANGANTGSSAASSNASSSSAMNMLVDEMTPGAGGGVGSSYFGVGARVYIDLAHAFLQRDRRKFVQMHQEHSALLKSDGNTSMIQQCERALFHRQLWHLSRIYAVIPLSQLSTHLDVEEEKMKSILLQLSMEKSWSIELQNDGMVVFNKHPKPKDSNDDESLETNIHELLELCNFVQKLDVAIATSPYYHALARRANEARMGPRGVEDL